MGIKSNSIILASKVRQLLLIAFKSASPASPKLLLNKYDAGFTIKFAEHVDRTIPLFNPIFVVLPFVKDALEVVPPI